MASRVELFDVTVTAGTPRTAPAVTATAFDDATVDVIEVLVPIGCNGLVGFQLRHSNAGIFPREDDRWIIANGETVRWDSQVPIDSGTWAIRAYNEGIHNHTLYVRMYVRENAVRATTGARPLDIAQPNQVAPASTEPGLTEEGAL